MSVDWVKADRGCVYMVVPMSNTRFYKLRGAARALASTVHLHAEHIDHRRVPALRAQLLRAVDSVPANIAEGAEQSTDQQALHFLHIAKGSLEEVGAHLETAVDSGAITKARYTACRGTCTVVKTMLTRLIERMKQ